MSKVPLSQIRAAIEQYIYCVDGDNGPHDPYNYTTGDDWDKAEGMMKAVVDWKTGDSGPLPSRSDYDERPYTEAGKKVHRLTEIAMEHRYTSPGYYKWLVDSHKDESS